MLEIRTLDTDHLTDFINVLKLRGEAPEDYYRWKYLDQPSNGNPVGFIAYFDGLPVGCIGIINRVFCAIAGDEHSSTWFADWFVLDSARGKGIGEALMSEVLRVSKYNFGIPGPLKAQLVCKSSGYDSLPGLFQYTLYVNSFWCGYKRFTGLVPKKLLRGLKSMVLSIPTKVKLLFIKGREFIAIPMLSEERFSGQSFELASRRTYLKRSGDFIDWMKRMPMASELKRSWWSINSPEFTACGFIEIDFWSLRKAVVVDVQSFQVEKAIWEITATLSKYGADWITFCYFDSTLSLPYWSKTALPLHAATEMKVENFYLTDLDKDSSWRSLLFTR